jgi:hypothetical protein
VSSRRTHGLENWGIDIGLAVLVVALIVLGALLGDWNPLRDPAPERKAAVPPLVVHVPAPPAVPPTPRLAPERDRPRVTAEPRPPVAVKWVDARGVTHFADPSARPASPAETIVLTPDRNVIQSVEVRPPERVRMVRDTKPEPVTVATTEGERTARCRHYEAALDAVRARMRSGYHAAEQPRLYDDERRYGDAVSRYCH